MAEKESPLKRTGLFASALAAWVFLFLLLEPALPQDDPYEKYVKTSRDFKPVKQDKD